MITVFPSEVRDIILDRLNYLVALSDATGEIVLANDAITRLFGYLPGELIGRSVDTLVPPDRRAQHRTHRTGFNAAPAERAMGERMALEGCRKDGTVFSVRIQLIPCVIRSAAVTIAIVFETTEPPVSGVHRKQPPGTGVQP